MDSMSAPEEIIKHLTSSWNKRILNSNLNTHEEIKNTGWGKYIGKYKRQYQCIFICNTFLILSDF